VLLQLGEHEEDMAKVLPMMDCKSVCQRKNEHKPVKEVLEDIIHQSLKCVRRIGEAERHDKELKQPLMRSESRLLNVLRPLPYMMIPGPEVQLSEVLGATQFIE
jgi:hypothetical protein